MVERDRRGVGDWAHWTLPLDSIYEAARQWEAQLKGVDKPWLCWNMSPRWCVVQQKLVRSVGWTPVVGCDPRVPAPPIEPGAILIDFNKTFQFAEMRMHFVLEWAFLYAPRLAFWHSDLLVRQPVMQHLARAFESLKDGEMAAVKERRGLRYLFAKYSKRYWELAGCTTRGASRSQFEHGSSWWRDFAKHPSCTDPAERARRARYYYEFGVAILYWKNNYGGVVRELDQRPLDEGHCTGINRKGYVHLAADNNRVQKYLELDMNFDLDEVVKRLDIEQFAAPPLPA